MESREEGHQGRKHFSKAKTADAKAPEVYKNIPSRDLTQLYWPVEKSNATGFILGWNIYGLVCCILDVVDNSIDEIEHNIQTMKNKPSIIGACNLKIQDNQALKLRNESDVWYTADTQGDKIEIWGLHLWGYKYEVFAHIFFYSTSEFRFLVPYEVPLVTILNPYKSDESNEDDQLQRVCNYLNLAVWSTRQIRSLQKKDKSESMYVNKQFVFCDAFRALLNMLLYRIKIPFTNRNIAELSSQSALVSCFVKRYNTLRYFAGGLFCEPDPSPVQYQTYISKFLRVYSVYYLIIWDFLIGLLGLYILYEFSDQALSIVHTLGASFHIAVLKSQVNWLMGLPAGFKPNEELDSSIGNMVLTVVECWNYITTYLTGFEPQIIRFFAICGLLGASFQMSMACDLVTICTLHIYYIYTVVRRVYALLLHVNVNLFRLMIGKKTNVLKRRIDTGEFGVDEVLIGIIIFTPIIFLTPTAAMYYLCFVITWMQVCAIRLFLQFLIVIINNFPFFTLIEYFMSPLLFPGGIYYNLGSDHSTWTSYLSIHPKKMPIGRLFAPMSHEIANILREFPPGQLIKNILGGGLVPVKA